MTVGDWLKKIELAGQRQDRNFYRLEEISGERFMVRHWPTGLLFFGHKWNYEPSEIPTELTHDSPIRQWPLCSF